METDGSSKLEYNLAGGLLLTIREKDLEFLTKGLVSSGYRYGCVLPFRGLTGEGAIEKLQNSSLSIVHLEEAWNPTEEKNIAKAVIAGLLHRRKLFGKKEGSFPPQYWDGLFSSKATCDGLFEQLYTKIEGVKVISHTFEVDFPSDRLLVEINPGIELSQSEILDISIQRNIGLVFDPSHLLASDKIISVAGGPTKPYKGEWERQFIAFSDQVRVVDINPPSLADEDDLFEGKGSLKELAQAAKEAGKVEFLRVEIPIPAKWQIPSSPLNQKGFDFLQAIGQRLMEG